MRLGVDCDRKGHFHPKMAQNDTSKAFFVVPYLLQERIPATIRRCFKPNLNAPWAEELFRLKIEFASKIHNFLL